MNNIFNILDYSIIGIYIVFMLTIGILMKKYADSGTDNYFNLKTGKTFIRTGDEIRIQNDLETETLAKFIKDGACELYHNDGKRFETTADGIQVTGKAFVDRTVTNTTGDHPALEIETLSTGTADDNFATGIDFKAAGTAVGRIAVDKGGDLTYFTDAAGSEVGLKIIDDGAVELYPDNSKKFATNA